MKIDYAKLANMYLNIAKHMAKELQTREDVIGIAVLGSTARSDVHSLSDIDLLVLVKGTDTFIWKRRIVQNIVVNIALRSYDVLRRMAKDHAETIFNLKNALILYDPEGILQMLKKNVTITRWVREEFIGDYLTKLGLS